ncbi:MAG: sigma-70 family RNA polymerase sigma factor [bacterium]
MKEETRISKYETAENIPAVRARDNRLVSRVLVGSDEAFEELVRLYYDRVRALVWHHLHREDELDDALQDIFLKAYRALPDFRRQSNFYTWLFRIASNYCIDRLKKRRLELVSLDDNEKRDGIEARVADKPETPEEKYGRTERIALVRKALMMLDPIHENIIVLREIEGLSYDEISETLGLGMGTVKSRLARARTELKSILEEMDIL